jgi:AcrR family transcriptional regulator
MLQDAAMAARSADVTAEKLLRAAHDLMVERAGNGASVSEICARAEVNVAMVKYCFGNKDGLLDALLDRALRQLAKELQRLSQAELAPEAKLRRHVAEIVRNYVRYPYVNRLMNERLLSADPDAVDRISRSFAIPARDWYAVLLKEGSRGGRWRSFDPTLFFFSVVGLCEFLFSARPLLERAFGEELDADLVERYSAQVAELVAAGVAAA